MELSADQLADTTVLTPKGKADHTTKIDHATAEGFRQTLLAALGTRPPGGFVVLDLGGVAYVASTGLRALLVGAKELKARGGSLVLAGLQPSVKEVLDITRLTPMFQVFATVPDALAAVSPAAAAAFAARPRI